MSIEITNDADKMLGLLYKTFLTRRKDGLSRREAKRFEDNYFYVTKPFSTMHYSDVADMRMELARAGLLKNYIGGDCELTDSAIYYLENRFKDGLTDVLSFLAQFIP